MTNNEKHYSLLQYRIVSKKFDETASLLNYRIDDGWGIKFYCTEQGILMWEVSLYH